MRKTLIFTAMSLLFLMLGSCKKEQTEDTIPDNDTIRSHPAEKIDSLVIKAQDSIARQDSLQLIKKKRADKYAVYNGEEYMSWPIKVSDSLRKAFYKKYNKEEIYIIAALNRIDTDNINRRDTIIVPKEVRTDIMSYSPFPHELSILDSIPKIAVFSYPIQAYALYEKGVLVKWGPTNMGKKTAQTPRGLFFTNWKGRKIKVLRMTSGFSTGILTSAIPVAWAGISMLYPDILLHILVCVYWMPMHNGCITGQISGYSKTKTL